jgi:D-beta-D-heptose 7-phosphate kinase/D-beta-D-heptose 1-phosphate adenosyltransferase
MASFDFSKKRLKGIVSGFSHSAIMVVGDSMLDEYIWGDVRRISPEAPVPVVNVESRSYRLGGAANVVKNLTSLGVKTQLVSLCGDDDVGATLKKELRNAGCSTDGVVSAAARTTTVKTRIMARHQQIVRVDGETVMDLTKEETDLLWRKFCEGFPSVSGVIISDYAKGVISPALIVKILSACKRRGIFIAIDPKERHFTLYKGVTVMTPNLKEAHAVLSIPYRPCTDDEIKRLGWSIVKKLDLPSLLITLSERGLALFERDKKRFTHLPTVAQKVFDVTGAGDTVISVYSAAMVCRAKPLEAAYLANHAAGLTVAELGTACITPVALLKAIDSGHHTT